MVNIKLIASALFLGALLSGSTFAACPCDEPDSKAAPVATDKGPESDHDTDSTD